MQYVKETNRNSRISYTFRGLVNLKSNSCHHSHHELIVKYLETKKSVWRKKEGETFSLFISLGFQTRVSTTRLGSPSTRWYSHRQTTKTVQTFMRRTEHSPYCFPGKFPPIPMIPMIPNPIIDDYQYWGFSFWALRSTQISVNRSLMYEL